MTRYWKVTLNRKAKKQLKRIKQEHPIIYDIYLLLERDLILNGPELVNWHNYGKLKGTSTNKDQRHCHLKKGRETWVACYEIHDRTIQLIEVYYVGTHEKAPY